MNDLGEVLYMRASHNGETYGYEMFAQQNENNYIIGEWIILCKRLALCKPSSKKTHEFANAYKFNAVAEGKEVSLQLCKVPNSIRSYSVDACVNGKNYGRFEFALRKVHKSYNHFLPDNKYKSHDLMYVIPRDGDMLEKACLAQKFYFVGMGVK